jgi:transcriptional regulator with XRE-family HTH domain
VAKEIDPSLSMGALFGTRVKRLRSAAGLTQEQLGRRLHVVGSRVAQIERATGCKPTLDLTRRLDVELEADELLVQLFPFLQRDAFPDWSRRFIELSAVATAIHGYAAHAVPGLLQTEAYARELLRTGLTPKTAHLLEDRVAARMSRQERLNAPDAPELWFVLDEAVLRRPVGDEMVMREQLRQLLRAAANPRTTVQVLPFESGPAMALGGSLTLLTLPENARPAYTEGADHGRLVEELDEMEDYAYAYDQVRALALPPAMSAEMIRSAMEEKYAARFPSRPEWRRVAPVQLQQPGGWRLRRGGGRLPRRGSGA